MRNEEYFEDMIGGKEVEQAPHIPQVVSLFLERVHDELFRDGTLMPLEQKMSLAGGYSWHGVNQLPTLIKTAFGIHKARVYASDAFAIRFISAATPNSG